MVTLIIILITAGVSILCFNGMGHLIFMIPIPVPGYIFAPLYLLYCWYMAKRNMDNIGHTAHFWEPSMARSSRYSVNLSYSVIS